MRRKDDNDMKPTTSQYCVTISACERSKALVRAAILGAVLLPSVSVAMAQVYGVAKKTTVVSGPNRTVVASKTTVVAGGGALPHGYIAVMPGGYRAVTVSGARYYTVGGIYYRPQIYQGRTVYVAVRL
jgi:hypothetical protein